jgi:hypothetical protein
MSLVQVTISLCPRDFINHHFDEGSRQESEFLRHSSMEQATLLVLETQFHGTSNSALYRA